MLRNLHAEMARFGVSTTDIARVTNKSDRSVRDKVRGKYDFTFSESTKIRDSFFPGYSLEYLFARDNEC